MIDKYLKDTLYGGIGKCTGIAHIEHEVCTNKKYPCFNVNNNRCYTRDGKIISLIEIDDKDLPEQYTKMFTQNMDSVNNEHFQYNEPVAEPAEPAPTPALTPETPVLESTSQLSQEKQDKKLKTPEEMNDSIESNITFQELLSKLYTYKWSVKEHIEELNLEQLNKYMVFFNIQCMSLHNKKLKLLKKEPKNADIIDPEYNEMCAKGQNNIQNLLFTKIAKLTPQVTTPIIEEPKINETLDKIRKELYNRDLDYFEKEKYQTQLAQVDNIKRNKLNKKQQEYYDIVKWILNDYISKIENVENTFANQQIPKHDVDVSKFKDPDFFKYMKTMLKDKPPVSTGQPPASGQTNEQRVEAEKMRRAIADLKAKQILLFLMYMVF